MVVVVSWALRIVISISKKIHWYETDELAMLPSPDQDCDEIQGATSELYLPFFGLLPVKACEMQGAKQLAIL